jgi:DUF4097 and DUF4098 domain-containing protein YvlB
MRLVFALLTIAAGAHAQLQEIPRLSFEGGNRQRFREIREQTIPSVGRLTVDPGNNGSVTVKGSLRNDISIRSVVMAQARSIDEARAIAGQVRVAASAGLIKASGPDSGWSVSYEISVPQLTDLSMTSFNGGINVSDVRGRIEFDTKNGGVRLTHLAGDVRGQTLNGGIQVELSGRTWEGGHLEARTVNGGVTISMPDNYSAHFQTETAYGAIDSDFPVSIPPQGAFRRQNLDFNLGSGGPVIHVSTSNGGIKLRRI